MQIFKLKLLAGICHYVWCLLGHWIMVAVDLKACAIEVRDSLLLPTRPRRTMLNNTACGSVRALLQQLQNAMHVAPIPYAQMHVCPPKQQGVNFKANMVVVAEVCAGQICIMAQMICHPLHPLHHTVSLCISTKVDYRIPFVCGMTHT